MTPKEGLGPSEEDLGIKSEEDKEEKQEKSDERIEKLDEAFDSLLDKVKDAPEAKQEALKIRINDMRQQAEHLSQVRDMKNFNELKRGMIRQWRKLEKEAGGDPVMLEKIQSWGEDFITEKLIYHDMVAEVKDELADSATEVESTITDIKALFGQVAGLTEAAGVTKGPFDRALDMSDDLNRREGRMTAVEKYLSSLTALNKGYDSSDIDMESGHQLVSSLQATLEKLSTLAYKKPIVGGNKIPIEEYPQIGEMIEELRKKIKEVSQHVNKSSKTFKVIKKIRDSQFLPLYNRQGPVGEVKSA